MVWLIFTPWLVICYQSWAQSFPWTTSAITQKRKQEQDTISIHLGAPTPHLEHSCVAPSFDNDVPFLRATLVKSGFRIQKPRKAGLRNSTVRVLETDKQTEGRKRVDFQQFNVIEKNILAKINNYNNVFMQKVCIYKRRILKKQLFFLFR